MNALTHTNELQSFIIKQASTYRFVLEAPAIGQIPLATFLFDASELGITFRMNDANNDSFFAAYSNKGLIVISGFHAGKGEHPTMSREFYFNVEH